MPLAKKIKLTDNEKQSSQSSLFNILKKKKTYVEFKINENRN